MTGFRFRCGPATLERRVANQLSFNGLGLRMALRGKSTLSHFAVGPKSHVVRSWPWAREAG
jgi:hypothetical protein